MRLGVRYIADSQPVYNYKIYHGEKILNYIKKLESIIGYNFNDKKLLTLALTHSSYANELRLGKTGSNERLEFLGDAALELISSEFFFNKYEHETEGYLTKTRAAFVCEPALAYCAETINLGSFLRLGKGEASTGGRLHSSVLSDALEALIGAVYLDGGFASAKEFVLRIVLNDIESKRFFFDSKTILQENIQKDSGMDLEYKLISEDGPDHMKTFTVSVNVSGKEIARAEGGSKKSAEQLAAHEALKKLGVIK